MSANVRDGQIYLLDGQAEPPEQVTESQAEDPPRVARVLNTLLKDLVTLKRRWAPRRIDWQAQAVDATGTTLYRFPHGFSGVVRWWPVGWVGAAGHQLSQHSSTTEGELVLVSYVAGTVTLRVEEGGS